MTKSSLKDWFDKAVDFVKEITAFGLDAISEIFTSASSGTNDSYQQLVDYYADQFMADKALQHKNHALASSIFSRHQESNIVDFNFAVLSKVDARSIIEAAHTKGGYCINCVNSYSCS